MKKRFTDCNWINDLVGKEVLQDLLEKSKLFSYGESYDYLFAKNGFTEGCIQASKDNNRIILITFKEMYQWTVFEMLFL